VTLVFLANLFTTLYLVGLIWFVQVVHYPLFKLVDPRTFRIYEREHSRRTAWVVVVPMLVELGTALWLLVLRPAEIPLWQAAAGAILVLVVWVSTFFLQVPQHNILDRGFDPKAHALLVSTNWLRTAAWSARGLLLLWMTARLLG
jgi:hypothetical protein